MDYLVFDLKFIDHANLDFLVNPNGLLNGSLRQVGGTCIMWK